MIRPPPARWSRYSRITRESNSTVPSSSTSDGILPSGFCSRTVSLAFIVSAGASPISRSSPSTLAAIRTLRTKGELGELRSVNTVIPCLRSNRRRIRGRQSAPPRRSDQAVARSAGDDEVDGLRTLALFIGLDVEGEALPLAQRFEPGPLDGGDVHEHVAAAIVRLDEAVAALGVEELDRTCHGHRETPFPVVAPPPAPTARRLGRTFTNGESSGLTASLTPPAPTGGGTSKPAR